MGYIGAHGVAALHRHKYSGVDHSLVAKYILQPFWTRYVNLFPLWMPPNMITLTGFTFLFISALLGYTFDAVDGRQDVQIPPVRWESFLITDAMRLHVRLKLWLSSTTMCGKSTFWFWVISAVRFYGDTWENFFTNALVLPVVNGPTEGLMLIYVSHFFTFLVGAEWWINNSGNPCLF